MDCKRIVLSFLVMQLFNQQVMAESFQVKFIDQANWKNVQFRSLSGNYQYDASQTAKGTFRVDAMSLSGKIGSSLSINSNQNQTVSSWQKACHALSRKERFKNFIDATLIIEENPLIKSNIFSVIDSKNLSFIKNIGFNDLENVPSVNSVNMYVTGNAKAATTELLYNESYADYIESVTSKLNIKLQDNLQAYLSQGSVEIKLDDPELMAFACDYAEGRIEISLEQEIKHELNKLPEAPWMLLRDLESLVGELVEHVGADKKLSVLQAGMIIGRELYKISPNIDPTINGRDLKLFKTLLSSDKSKPDHYSFKRAEQIESRDLVQAKSEILFGSSTVRTQIVSLDLGMPKISVSGGKNE